MDENNENTTILPSEKFRLEELEKRKKEKELIQRKKEIMVKKFLTGFFYSFFILLVLWISILLSFSETIWFLERFFGLISYLLFFLTISFGILRKLGPKFIWTIKYHKPTAIWAFIFLIAHIISVIFDNYKWGYQLSIWTYFGFDYSSKWLWPVSVGALGFWSFLIIIATSVGKNMSRLGFKLWKKIHYISYIAFVLMSVHAFFIGTDFKTGSYSFFVYWIAFLMNILVSIFLISRIIYSFKKNKK